MTTILKINPGIFKANDIRGKYPSEINEKVVSEIVERLGKFFNSGKIIIAHDARLSSPKLYRAAIKGMMNNELGIKNKNKKPIIHNSPPKADPPLAEKFIILKAGLATTPMFYFLVKKLKAGGGVIITASHNPKNYNGLKIVDKNALPISGITIKKSLNL